MRARAIAALAGVALAVIAAGGCGDDGGTGGGTADAGPSGPPREVVMENVPLVVTEIVEAIIAGGVADDYARITMTAGGAPFDWNLHGHANGSTQIVAEGLGVTDVDYLFVPSASADWYLLIRNKGPTDINVQLRVELFGAMTWSGWQ